jgi:uncharacterized protein YlxP (DUF503 family)
MAVAVLTLQIELPGCRSLKEKRARIKPLLTRLHREFNISTAELANQDDWDQAIIGCALISNDRKFSAKALKSVVDWLEKNWPDVTLVDDQIEIIT